jgi:predicted DNA-binding transcriptional regulator AlpA
MNVPQLLTKQKTAEILGMHENSVMRLVKSVGFPNPIKTGGRGSAVRFRERDVAEWINARASANDRRPA